MNKPEGRNRTSIRFIGESNPPLEVAKLIIAPTQHMGENEKRINAVNSRAKAQGTYGDQYQNHDQSTLGGGLVNKAIAVGLAILAAIKANTERSHKAAILKKQYKIALRNLARKELKLERQECKKSAQQRRDAELAEEKNELEEMVEDLLYDLAYKPELAGFRSQHFEMMNILNSPEVDMIINLDLSKLMEHMGDMLAEIDVIMSVYNKLSSMFGSYENVMLHLVQEIAFDQQQAEAYRLRGDNAGAVLYSNIAKSCKAAYDAFYILCDKQPDFFSAADEDLNKETPFTPMP